MDHVKTQGRGRLKTWAAAGAGTGEAPPIWGKPQAVVNYQWDGKEWRLNSFTDNSEQREKIPRLNRKKGAHQREAPTGWRWEQRGGVRRKNWSGNHGIALLMGKSKSTSTSECQKEREGCRIRVEEERTGSRKKVSLTVVRTEIVWQQRILSGANLNF